MKYIRVSAALLCFAAGCARGDKSSDTANQAPAAATGVDRATAAASVANAIKANPAAADSILKAAGYTAESFERAMYEIAADSSMSAAYAAAKTK